MNPLEERLHKYFDTWNAAEIKPCNDREFIEDFIALTTASTYDLWDFTGENGYCGFTAHFGINTGWGVSSAISFELAYRRNGINDFVKVFTSNHGGFWVPEYIYLLGADAQPILDILKEKLSAWAGIPIAEPNVERNKTRMSEEEAAKDPWKPIETAPTDKVVDLFVPWPKNRAGFKGFRYADCYFDNGYWYSKTSWQHKPIRHASHWMEKPGAPL